MTEEEQRYINKRVRRLAHSQTQHMYTRGLIYGTVAFLILQLPAIFMDVFNLKLYIAVCVFYVLLQGFVYSTLYKSVKRNILSMLDE